MKNIFVMKWPVFWAVIATIATSCSGFLDEDPKSLRSADNFFQDEKSIQSGLLGIYEAFNDLYIDPSTPFLGELGTDQSIAVFTQNNITPLYYYTITANDLNVMPNWYKYHYKTICNANTLLNRASALQESSPEIKKMLAEAKALRAWCYFRLVQSLGPVPIVLDEVTGAVDYGVPRAPVKDVYARIVTDLKEASDEVILPLESTKSVRLNHWAVRAMLGKVYLTMASTKETGIVDKLMAKLGKQGYGYDAIEESVQELYEKARTVLGDIYENSGIELEKEYGKLFTATNKNTCPEIMWELQAADGVTGSVTGKGFYFLFRYGMSNGSNLSPVLNGVWRKDVVFAPAMMVRANGGYQEGDVRKAWNLCAGYKTLVQGEWVPQYIRTFYNPTTKKYTFMGWTLEKQESDWAADNWFYTCITKYRFNTTDSLHVPTSYTDNRSLPLNFPALRYADVLLMYAEACLKANGGQATQETVDCMNLVRDRAREKDSEGIPLPNASLPQYTMELTMDSILNERKLELCFESVRWFDLARTGKLFEKYNEMIPTGNQSHKTLDPENDMKYYLYPIPAQQINVSTNKDGFFQNYGY